MPTHATFETEGRLAAFGAELVTTLKAGDVVLLAGPLGAGKTTLARAMLRALGWTESVRSPTYNILHAYPTSPPVLHADLYRVDSAAGLGLEEYFDTHLCLIEWPDRLHGALDARPGVVKVSIEITGDARRVTVSRAP